MAIQPTGTLETLNDFLSDTSMEIALVKLRVTEIAQAISDIADEFSGKISKSLNSINEKDLEEQIALRLDPLNRELEQLLEVKQKLEALKR